MMRVKINNFNFNFNSFLIQYNSTEYTENELRLTAIKLANIVLLQIRLFDKNFCGEKTHEVLNILKLILMIFGQFGYPLFFASISDTGIFSTPNLKSEAKN